MRELPLIAAEIAREYHAGAVDRAGVDYYEGHLCHVAAAVADDPIAVAVAYLHDVIEDRGVSAHALIEMLCVRGVPADVAVRVVAAVVAMSKVPGVSYNEYLDAVAADPIAVRVKLADLRHNSDLSRLHVVSEEDVARVAKRYLPAIARLSAL